MFTKGDIESMVRSAKNGDKNAVENLCSGFKGFIINSARKIYIRGYEMEDLIQEGYKAIIMAVHSYDTDRNTFTGYAVNAIRNNFYCIMRNNLSKPYSASLNSINSQGDELMNTLFSDENIEEYFESLETKSVLKEAVASLSDKEKDIIYWYYAAEKSIKQYCVFRKMPYRTASYRKKKAVEKLRKFMEKKGEI
ncbi:sigma-70 family RNA polymerase sigma factor [Clostridium tyrobutyricum]|uniref:sigma-70 family RNA polymerase sigma factor n=1 Tax=Clostridium tyrobutyricum TaxID=1519 RepID=UPI0030CD3ADA